MNFNIDHIVTIYVKLRFWVIDTILTTTWVFFWYVHTKYISFLWDKQSNDESWIKYVISYRICRNCLKALDRPVKDSFVLNRFSINHAYGCLELLKHYQSFLPWQHGIWYLFTCLTYHSEGWGKNTGMRQNLPITKNEVILQAECKKWRPAFCRALITSMRRR